MKRSHGDFGWRRAGTESWVGVMIQRITLAIIRDLREEIDRAERKRETGTEEERETRWRIQAGIVTEYRCPRRLTMTLLLVSKVYLGEEEEERNVRDPVVTGSQHHQKTPWFAR